MREAWEIIRFKLSVDLDPWIFTFWPADPHPYFFQLAGSEDNTDPSISTTWKKQIKKCTLLMDLKTFFYFKTNMLITRDGSGIKLVHLAPFYQCALRNL